ncbi:putative hydrolase of the HAD superfamily [Thermocatellispora tengchongensis]|uniref:Putative hydrolase of the HAD superfamily n=1 Tax=Thermocatellispora tengchongensis TaxID=1073253 RepID=A0A840NS98_9ACTN|nr:HAD family hydrolase [Thermocatellispora tengchongensis]MBB5130448.1 putative hydrolase of the HAD superfamily [Thermocatellispora tengchongensis]
MTVRGVLFDVDDTLFAYSACERAGLLRYLAAEGMLEAFGTPDDAVALWHRIMEEEYPRFLAGELTFAGQQVARARRFLAHAGRATSPEQAAAWFAGYREVREEVEAAYGVFPDALPALEALAGRVRLGVVSNSSLPHQCRKLRAVGLLGHFGDALVCSGEHGVAKPDPSIFLAGCAALGLEAYEVAYVGDRYDVDALGARDAGLRAYWLVRDGHGERHGDGHSERQGDGHGERQGDGHGERRGDGHGDGRPDGHTGGHGVGDDGITVIRSLDELVAAVDGGAW